jgi:hypothetical protein
VTSVVVCWVSWVDPEPADAPGLDMIVVDAVGVVVSDEGDGPVADAGAGDWVDEPPGSFELHGER